MTEKILINDVGPRDGLQNQPKLLNVEQRLSLLHTLVGAGLQYIEFGAFVSPSAVPAMAGSDVLARQLPRGDVHFSALIPNRKGYDIGRANGIAAMNLVIAASNSMNLKNIRMSTARALAFAADILQQARNDGIAINISIATAWECAYEGAVDPGVVAQLTRHFFELGANAVVIADTIGGAQPRAVRALMDRLVAEHGAEKLWCHFHDTRALGSANAYAALESGIRQFDASIGGLGGCPFAPGATGNIATEDLAMMLELMGFDTGIDIEKLLAAARIAGELIGTSVGGRSTPWLARNLARFNSGVRDA
jgi:hydroxymethylglutaryl-CoA lyase